MDRRRVRRGVALTSALTPALPLPRTPGRYAVALVCLGNICRSPMADVVLSQRLEDAGLAGRVTVTSGGTGDWHVGKQMDRRAAATLRAHDYDPSLHRARQFAPAWLAANDLVLAMDAGNLAQIGRVAAGPGEHPGPERVRLFGDFDPVAPGGEVPDPYYGGDEGFEEVLVMVERTCAALLAAIQQLPGLGPDTGPDTGPGEPAGSPT